MAETRARDTADVVADVPLLAAGLSNRNLLFNGAMQVAQRGTSTAGITGTGGYYTADRWGCLFDFGTWTQSVENDAPTGSGLRKSLKMLCTSANASPSASNQNRVTQFLEGQDLQRIAKGTSGAHELTVSFWVKSNNTGTYTVTLSDTDNSRLVSAQYTVNASAEWERKEVTFPADTTGAFDNDDSGSLYLLFYLGVGSDRSSGTLATDWEPVAIGNIAPGQTNLAAATNNYWQVTGVQLEAGPVATGFEHKSYGAELAECQRYYEACSFNGAGWITSAGSARTGGNWHVQKRATPSLHGSAGTGFIQYGPGGQQTISSISTFQGTSSGVLFDVIVPSGLTTNHPCTIQVAVFANAEL